MDLILVAVLAGLAFLGGAWAGYRDGLQAGRAEEAVRRRLAELPKPWLPARLLGSSEYAEPPTDSDDE